MKLQSLCGRTNCIFHRFSGEVVERQNYVLIQTKTNPGFHWGNYIIFDSPPNEGDYENWTEIYKKEFDYYRKFTHMVLTWEQEEKGEIQEFLDRDFKLEDAKVLSASHLVKPPRFNPNVEIRKLKSDEDWNRAVEMQIACADPEILQSGYRNFKERQMSDYRRMSKDGLGHWYGAYLDGKLVGDLGIFRDKELGRYQNVGTHPEFRKQGICQTLVYLAGTSAMEEFGLERLVVVADANYHAARIYESVGFKLTEKKYALSWWIPHD